jgi:FMN phosphatase YigB (HAD superfamily)
MNYSDIDGRKQAFIFELDDVLYPEKDYLYQVYYLFASILEYTEHIDAKTATDLMVTTYNNEGKSVVFDRLKEQLNVDEKFRGNLNHLLLTAKLPLKLLLFQNMLTLLQDIIVDRKKIFIVTNGNPEQQLNKIKQTEWHGLEKYLICYFANETIPKPDSASIDLLINDHNLQRREVLMIENSATDKLCAEAAGIDTLNIKEFIK